ncbi:MAG: peptidoglycan DD-metalloendopeptidase family protein, partial [Bdellovibrionales bacterium]|nr:peptidoglycan DD-metalloendopeptidase family protein [Bdellovibrionales bacterium]
GPTIVTEHQIGENKIYALFGHMSLESLENKTEGQAVKAGDVIGFIGDRDVTGGWFPHVHFQLSLRDPGKADMPGVVNPSEAEQILLDYPDPQWVLGRLY